MFFPGGRKSKLKHLLKEMQKAIAEQTSTFSLAVRARYGQLNDMVLRIGALGFFVHAVDRLSFRPHSETLRDAILDVVACELSQSFGRKIGSRDERLAATAESDMLHHINVRGALYGKTPSLVGKSGDSRSNAVWVAACTIAEDVGHPEDVILVMLIQTRLMQGLIDLDLAKRIESVEELIS